MSFNLETATSNITNDLLIQHGDHICGMIQGGTDIFTISNVTKNFIARANKQLNNDWQGEHEFNVFTEDNHILISFRNCIGYATRKTLSNQKEPSYYVCVETHPPGDGINGSGFKRLSRDMHEATLSCGYAVTRNGTSRKLEANRLGARFKYRQCQSYRGNSEYCKTLDYKKVSYNSNQLNKRLSYDPSDPSLKLKLTRRRDTILPMKKDMTCPFSFTISYNNLGFYVVNGMGNNTHKHHPKISYQNSYVPTSLINNETEAQLLKDLANGEAGFSLLQNILLLKKTDCVQENH